MVDIVTAVLIGFCFAAVVGALTFTSYKKSENETRVRIQEIQHGVVKETKRADFGTGYTPMWTQTFRTTMSNATDRVGNDSVTEMKNVVTSTSNKTCDLDPTTAFPKVEEAKSYKAEPNESVD